MEMPDSTYSEELNRVQRFGDAPCSAEPDPIKRAEYYLESKVITLRTKIRKMAVECRAASKALADVRSIQKTQSGASQLMKGDS